MEQYNLIHTNYHRHQNNIKNTKRRANKLLKSTLATALQVFLTINIY